MTQYSKRSVACYGRVVKSIVLSGGDRQSAGSNPGRDTCVLDQDTQPRLLRPSDGTLSRKSRVLMHVKEPRSTHR